MVARSWARCDGLLSSPAADGRAANVAGSTCSWCLRDGIAIIPDDRCKDGENVALAV